MKKLARKPLLFGLILLIFEQLLVMLAAVIAAVFASLFFPGNSTILGITQSILSIAAVLLATLLVKRWLPEELKMGLHRKNLGFACLLLLPMLIEPVLYAVTGYMGTALAAGVGTEAMIHSFFSGLNPGVTEEVLFRGWIFGNMLCCWRDKKWGVHMALAASSLIFSLAHSMNMLSGQSLVETINQLAFALAMGCIFAAAYCRSGNLIAPILFHSSQDIVAYFLYAALGDSAHGDGVSVIQLLIYAAIIAYSFFLIRPAKREAIAAHWGAAAPAET